MMRSRWYMAAAPTRARFCWCCVGVLLAGAGSVYAQRGVGSQSARPSDSINNTLSGTLGRLSGANNALPSRSANSVATVAPPSGGGFRGGGRAPDFFQPRNYGRAGGALMGRRYPSSMQSGFGGRGGGLNLPPFSADRPLLLLRTEGTEGWEPAAVASNIAVQTGSPTTRPTAEAVVASDKNQLRRDDVARDYIAGRRDGYMKDGWNHFRAGRYRQACDIFSLAEAVTLDDPKARTEVEVAILHAGVASGQYSLALNALKFLLSDDPYTGNLRNPDFLNYISDVESFYGTKEDYVTHVRLVEQLALDNTKESGSKALRAVILWGKKDRVNAMFFARQLVDPTIRPPWPRLYGMMERARATEPGARSAGPTSGPAPVSAYPTPSPVTVR